MFEDEDKIGCGCMAALLVIALVIGGIFLLYFNGSEAQHKVTVKEKVVKPGSESSKYLIFTDEGDVYEITDNIFLLRFDSSNVYGSIDEGQTYNITTKGWRFELLSWYPNVLEVKETTDV